MGICESIKQKIKQNNDSSNKYNDGHDYQRIGESFGRPFLGPGKHLPDNYIELCNNWMNNTDIMAKIYEENKAVAPKMAEKIKELRSRGEYSSTPVMIGTGNSCNNPCYMYNIPIMTKCPKCGGKVESSYENGYTTKETYNDTYDTFETVKNYNESQICDGFRWNNNVHLKDVDLDELEKYYDKEDHANKVHWTIHTLDRKTQEKGVIEVDVPRHYAIIDGERFDFPYGTTIRQFLYYNEGLFFPEPKLADVNNGNELDYSKQICFFYQYEKKDLGQSLGLYGYAWMHKVIIFSCNSCGHKYHIIKTSPFAWENK